MPSALGTWSLNCWTVKEVPKSCVLDDDTEALNLPVPKPDLLQGFWTCEIINSSIV